MIQPERIAPSEQVKAAIVDYLRGMSGGFAQPIPDTQIRGMLDLSGTPKDAYGIIVACDDLGEHGGMNNHGILIDVRPRVLIFTHLNEDEDGSLCSSLVSDVLSCLRRLTYSLDGWHVAWTGNWATTPPVMDGSYRQCELSAMLPLNRLFR